MSEESSNRPIESPFRVDQDAADKGELREFVENAEAALRPSLAEILSEETRKTQHSLLVVSCVVMLLAVGALEFSGKLTYQGFQFSIQAKTLLEIASLVCIYFEVLVGIRCLNDWTAFRLKGALAELDIASLWYEFNQSLPGRFIYSKEFLKLRSAKNWATTTRDRADEPERKAEAEKKLLDVEKRLLEWRQEYEKRARVSSKKFEWFQKWERTIRWSRFARVLWEVSFPLLLGIASLVLAGRVTLAHTP